MFERRATPLIPLRAFFSRLFGQIALTLVMMILSLGFGMVGYHYFEKMPWIDCFLNAAMLLGGMGEVDVLKTNGGKIFAALYALYAGIFTMVCAGLLLAPVFHRILHHFHAVDDGA